MRFGRYVFLVTLLLTLTRISIGQVNFEKGNLLLGPYTEVALDSTNSVPADKVLSTLHFEKSTVPTPNFGLTTATIWLKFTIINQSDVQPLLLELAYPMLDTCILYPPPGDTGRTHHIYEGDSFDKRTIKHENIVFPIYLKKGEAKTYLMKIRGNEQVVAPLILRNGLGFIRSTLEREIIAGIHIGVLVVMILYNLFLFFSIRERSYLYYVLYILFIGLTQTTIAGYTFKYLWPNSPNFNNLAIILFPSLAGLFAIGFFKNFLDTPKQTPWLDKILNIMIVPYVAAVILRFIGYDMISYRFIDICSVVSVLTGFLIALKLSWKGYRPARYFLIAWTIFLIGIVLFVMRNLNLLPYNTFTNYTMQAGTAIEVILLSLALADKINILKKEREASQAETIRITQEKADIISKQNIILEQKVTERTIELSETNSALNNTLTKLRDAQTQLIESEKMASLGQLTAGIAHEINNPINFVSSNIKPLRRDIEDLLDILAAYEKIEGDDTSDTVKQKLLKASAMKDDLDFEYIKEEIDTLLKGMQEGASRTVGIVKGLKVFSRVDEAERSFVNINEGLESTLVILNNQMGSRIKLIRDFGSLPNIECYAGKLNQVFMNIITNAIDAINEHIDRIENPQIEVRTKLMDSEHVSVSIKDNGVGMPPEVKAKIFEPFFTTKDVGKGTGLGLSIVFKIIEAHNGTIHINTAVGAGTEFLITLPVSIK